MPDKVYVVEHWMAYSPSVNVFASLDKGKAEDEAKRLNDERPEWERAKEWPDEGYSVDELELQ